MNSIRRGSSFHEYRHPNTSGSCKWTKQREKDKRRLVEAERMLEGFRRFKKDHTNQVGKKNARSMFENPYEVECFAVESICFVRKEIANPLLLALFVVAIAAIVALVAVSLSYYQREYIHN